MYSTAFQISITGLLLVLCGSKGWLPRICWFKIQSRVGYSFFMRMKNRKLFTSEEAEWIMMCWATFVLGWAHSFCPPDLWFLATPFSRNAKISLLVHFGPVLMFFARFLQTLSSYCLREMYGPLLMGCHEIRYKRVPIRMICSHFGTSSHFFSFNFVF